MGILFFFSLDLVLKAIFSGKGGVCNTGIAFGIPISFPFILLFSGVVVGYCIIRWRRERETTLILIWGLIAFGGLSNFLDRALFGCVHDYLTLPAFPSLNLADMMLSLGVGWFFFFSLFPRRIKA